MEKSTATTAGVQQPVNNTSDVAQSNPLSAFLPFIAIFVLFYFLIIRPQQKREAQKKEKLGKLKKGDKVVTNSGIIGEISKIIDDNRVIVKISDNTEVEMYKSFVAEIIDTKLHTVNSDKQKTDNVVKDKKTTKGKVEPKKSKETKEEK